MTGPWALRVARGDAATLVRLRLSPGVEVAESPEHLWLRGPAGDAALGRELAAVPAMDRFHREDLQTPGLFRVGERVPWGPLPPGLVWRPLSAWLAVELPSAAWLSEDLRPVSLRLEPSSDEVDAGILLTTVGEWAAYAREAPLLRLKPLRFAASTDGRVLVQGQPLPPLAGRRFVLLGSIAVPAGWRWQPAVPTEILARRFSVAEGDIVLWYEDGTLARVHGELFMPATRSGARATADELGG